MALTAILLRPKLRSSIFSAMTDPLEPGHVHPWSPPDAERPRWSCPCKVCKSLLIQFQRSCPLSPPIEDQIHNSLQRAVFATQFGGESGRGYPIDLFYVSAVGRVSETTSSSAITHMRVTREICAYIFCCQQHSAAVSSDTRLKKLFGETKAASDPAGPRYARGGSIAAKHGNLACRGRTAVSSSPGQKNGIRITNRIEVHESAGSHAP